LKDRLEFKDLVSQVFTFDYIGALLASLLFPLVLVPHLGLVRSSFFVWRAERARRVGDTAIAQTPRDWAKLLMGVGIVVLTGLLVGFGFSEKLLAWSEKSAYVDTVIFARSTAISAHRGYARCQRHSSLSQ